MKSGRGLAGALSLRFKLFLIVAGPLLVALAFALDLPDRLAAPSVRVKAGMRISELAGAFEQLLLDAREIPTAALRYSPRQAARNAGASPLTARLEGVALLDSDLQYLEWEGTPAEPGPMFAEPQSPPWSVRLDGVATRLLVRAGPDGEGRIALASFLIDSRLHSLRFVDLLPEEIVTGIHLEVEFADVDAGEPGLRREGAMLMLRSPAGDLLATASVQPIPREHSRERLAAAGRAWALLLLLLLAALLFDWKERSTSWIGFATITALLILGRLALLYVRAPSLLLPRELGTASLFGSSEAWRLLASPADLLLTTTALYLFAISVRSLCVAVAKERALLAALICAGAAGAVTFAAFRLALSVAHNSTLPLLDRPAITGWNAQSMIVVALALALLGAAELWALIRLLPGRRAAPSEQHLPRIPVALCLIILTIGCSVMLQRITERLALERLDAEFAPQVLQQSARRSLALSAAIRHIDHAYREDERVPMPRGSQRDFMAYHFWVSGQLFHSGYKASLDFYNPAGDLLSHFGFELPAFDETIVPGPEALPHLTIKSEEFTPAPAVEQQLLHAEMTIARDGALLGVVVGHILDEPENLPFLSWSQPYLAALGPGSPYSRDESAASGPDYVLYDERGRVVLNTLRQPPAETAEILQSAGEKGTVSVSAGDEKYRGLYLRDGERLHLLLLQAHGPIERLAAAVRLALIGLLLLGAVALLPLLLPPHGPAYLLRKLRGSFHRKLLASLLLASVVPLVGLSLFLRGYSERQGDAQLVSSATQFVGAAQRLVEDYAATSENGSDAGEPNDKLLYWLRRLLGQEIHVYENGLLRATSKRELFAAGLLSPRIDGEVQRRIVSEGLPSLIVWTRIGPSTIPVAYAPVRTGDPSRDLVVAVPIVFEQQQIARAVDRVTEMLLLATVLLVGLLAVVAAYLARTVARPVRDLVGATVLIASGDYAARLEPRTQDEVAELVHGFNSMATSLAEQRADLERRRDYMERLLLHATTGVISTDPRGRIVTFNPAARELLSAAGEELRVGADLTSALASADELKPLAAMLPADDSKRDDPREIDFERQGEPHRFRLVCVELPDPSGGSLGRLILLDDVTELMRSNQLAAWAEMARAIAHEIKNPLTPIQLSTEHLQKILRDRGILPAPEIETCLETVIKQVRVLHQIAGEFSAYAKLPDLTPVPIDPVAFMRAAIGPYRAANPPDIEIKERYESCGMVAVDERVLSRAVVNLVENALQAMPDGGTLTVGVAPDRRSDGVLLVVEDSGVGLDPEVKKRLFEPYFSTKSFGTGLGLAIVLRAVEAHKGRIEVDSEVGGGTRFRIFLPPLDN